jgi:hypothetical protein
LIAVPILPNVNIGCEISIEVEYLVTSFIVLIPGGINFVMDGMVDARLDTDLPPFTDAEIVGNAFDHFSLIIWSDFIRVCCIIFAESLFVHTSRMTCSRPIPSEKSGAEKPDTKHTRKIARSFVTIIFLVIKSVPELV